MQENIVMKTDNAVESPVSRTQGNNNEVNSVTGEQLGNKPLAKIKPRTQVFPMWLAIIVLIVNIMLPGIGTFIATAKITDRTYISFYCFSGLCQFLTFICIIGWVFALIHSIGFISAACAKMSIEDHLASEAKEKGKSRLNQVQKPHTDKDGNQDVIVIVPQE